MVKINKKALDNVVMYNEIIRDRNMFVLVGLMIVLLISALIKYFNVLEGFGDLTRKNIGPVDNESRIKNSTWNGIKKDVMRKNTNESLQSELKTNWKTLITETEGLHYALHSKFPYPETVIKCIMTQKEKEYKNENRPWNQKAIDIERKKLENYETSLPIRSFVKLAKYKYNNCLMKIPELEFLNKLNDKNKGITTSDNSQLFCELGNDKNLKAFDISTMEGEKRKSNPHYVGVKELEKVTGFKFMDKPCNPCEDMNKCKFALDNKISPVARMWWGIDNAANSQIL